MFRVGEKFEFNIINHGQTESYTLIELLISMFNYFNWRFQVFIHKHFIRADFMGIGFHLFIDLRKFISTPKNQFVMTICIDIYGNCCTSCVDGSF